MNITLLPPVSTHDIQRILDHVPKPVCFLGGNGSGWQPTMTWRPIEKFVYKKSSKTNHGQFLTFLNRQQKYRRKVIGFISYDHGNRQFGISRTPVDVCQTPDIYCLAYDNYITFGEESTSVHYKDQEFLNEYLELLENRSVVRKSKHSVAFKTTMSRDYYDMAFARIKHYILEGDIYQINFTQRLAAISDIPAREVFARLTAVNKVGYQAYIEGPGFELISMSPECFIRTRGKTIETFPVKGTTARSLDPLQDAQNQKKLQFSEKETAELHMITDLMRNDLGKVCQIGSVEVLGERTITPYASVWHAHSHVQGRLMSGVSSAEALLSMSPGGSITGCPKKRAMEIIAELEPMGRGIYTGSIFTIEPNGDIDSSIAIRTIIKKGKELHLQVGGGIVHDSELDSEYQETFDKAKSLIEALK